MSFATLGACPSGAPRKGTWHRPGCESSRHNRPRLRPVPGKLCSEPDNAP